MPEELVGKRPGFGAKGTLPPRQAWFPPIDFFAARPQGAEPGRMFFRSPASLCGTLALAVRFELHILAFCLRQPALAKVIEYTLVVHRWPLFLRGLRVPCIPDIGRSLPRRP